MKVEKWSKIIKQRRLSWLGHLLRLDEKTPAQIALKESCRKVKRNIGKNKTTWIQVVKNDVKNSTLEINLNDKTHDVVNPTHMLIYIYGKEGYAQCSKGAPLRSLRSPCFAIKGLRSNYCKQILLSVNILLCS